MAVKERKFSTVPLNWKEVYFTNCCMVAANNIDQELGWCKDDFKKIGVDYSYFRSRRENDYYPHYIHNLDNLIRFGGLLSAGSRTRRHASDASAGCDLGLRGRMHARALQGSDLQDAGPQGKEGRPIEEPEHDQDRLVAHIGTPGHREHAPPQ